MEPLTKQEAIKLHRKMWNWIADETEKRNRKVYKYEYFKEMDIPKDKWPYSLCYCCEYNDQQISKYCNSCPIDWNSESSFIQCAYKYKINDHKGLFMLWENSKDHIESAKLARQIANLAERTDGE